MFSVALFIIAKNNNLMSNNREIGCYRYIKYNTWIIIRNNEILFGY